MNKTCVFVLIILFGCGRSADKLPQEKRVGINGEAIYKLRGDSVVMVFKQELNSNKNKYAILINRDTITLGDSLKSIVHVWADGGKVKIKSPSDTIIHSYASGFWQYNFKPTAEGVYDFSGIIEYDSNMVPFDYKFIVIKARE